MKKKNNYIFNQFFNSSSLWFCKKFQYNYFLKEDKTIRKIIQIFLKLSLVKIYYEIYYIEIKRKSNLIQICIFCITNYYLLLQLKRCLQILNKKIKKNIFYMNSNLLIIKIKNNYLYPNILVKFIYNQINKKISLNKILKKTLILTELITQIQGIKIQISGKIYYTEQAISEYIKEGNISVQTINQKVEYKMYKINTKYGILSIRIWIFFIS